LAPPPDWSALDVYQGTITRGEFLDGLNHWYAPRDAWKPFIEVDATEARIRTRSEKDAPIYQLQFRTGQGETKGRTVSPKESRFWRLPTEMPPLEDPAKPLAGVRIAIDPGHLGGPWAKMEGRWFQIGDEIPITEGDMVLIVSRLVREQLEQLGAEVQLVRETTRPVTRLRRIAFLNEAYQSLLRSGRLDGWPPAAAQRRILKEAEKLFYRTAEIRARAELINETIQPDLVLCLHFNADAWGNPNQPQLVDRHHFHLLLNGCYEAYELALDDARFQMLHRLLSRVSTVELPAGKAAVTAMKRETDLPPYRYGGTNAWALGDQGYLWARNLLANRIYAAPVLFYEPFVMNSQLDYPRLQTALQRWKEAAPDPPPADSNDLFEEYARAVVEGVKQYYAAARQGS